MELITNKRGIRKIALILVILLLFNFVITNYSQAIAPVIAIIGIVAVVGSVLGGSLIIANVLENPGELFMPIAKLIRTLANIVYRFIQNSFYTENAISSSMSNYEPNNSNEVGNVLLNSIPKKYYENLTDEQVARGTILKEYAMGEYLGANDVDENGQKTSIGWDGAWKKMYNEIIDEETSEHSPDWWAYTSPLILYIQAIRYGVYIFGNEYQDDIRRSSAIANSATFSEGIAWIGPGVIFANKVPLLEANFINPTREHLLGETVTLSEVVAKWYNAFRTIALVGLMSVLIYIGIRMLLTSISSEKAKYKKMLLDWLVAVLMLFFLQYIMLFIITIANKIVEIFANSNVIGPLGEDKLLSMVRFKGLILSWSDDTSQWISAFGYVIAYCVLIIWTIMFLVQYIKRVAYMAFFTMISPLVALTYPLDKIKDGKAQAFSMLIREYTFNALLPVIHIVLYTVFVGSLPELMNTNPLFAVIILGCMIPAEKLLRKMFGFEKSDTASPMAAAAGGALMMNAMNKIKAPASSGKSGGGSSGNSKAPRTKGGDKKVDAPILNSQNGGPTGGGPTGGGPTGGGPTGGGPTGGGPTGGSTATPKNKNTALRRIGGALGRSAGHLALKGAKGLGNMAKNAAFKAPGMLLGGTLGAIAGVASGDMSKGLSYGLAGATALGNFTGNLGNNLWDTAGETGAIAAKSFMGSEEYNNKMSDKAFYQSQEYQDLIANTAMRSQFGPFEMRDAIQTYRDSGITDTGKIIKATKLGLNAEQGALALKVRDQIYQYDLQDPTKAAMLKTQFESGMGGFGMSQADLDKIWTAIGKL